MTDMTAREQEVINWSTQEIDPGVKLGDKIAEMLETDGGLFDATAHDALDHTGLPGVPAEPVLVANQADSTANDVAGIVSDFNDLLAALQTAGVMDSGI